MKAESLQVPVGAARGVIKEARRQRPRTPRGILVTLRRDTEAMRYKWEADKLGALGNQPIYWLGLARAVHIITEPWLRRT